MRLSTIVSASEPVASVGIVPVAAVPVRRTSVSAAVRPLPRSARSGARAPGAVAHSRSYAVTTDWPTMKDIVDRRVRGAPAPERCVQRPAGVRAARHQAGRLPQRAGPEARRPSAAEPQPPVGALAEREAPRRRAGVQVGEAVEQPAHPGGLWG